MAYRRRTCYFCDKKMTTVDYKDPTLRNFLTEKGKIIPSKVTGICTRHQRLLTRAIKQARVAALLPYVTRVT